MNAKQPGEFMRQCWYVAAWDHEIPTDGLFERRLLGESIVFYRNAAGQVVALANKCCHRHAPLSMGRKEGDCIRCMYHGLKYDASGQCVEVPGQANVPTALRVRSYPIVERKRWIWIWMGDPARVDESLIPDTFSLQDPAWRMKPAYLLYKAGHEIIADNLLDFSHLSYVHESTLGGTTKIAEVRAKMERLPRGLRLERNVLNSVPAPYHVKLGAPTGPVDRWWVYDYLLPGILLLDSGVKPAAGAPQSAGKTLHFHSCQAITPETAQSTHYFFMQAHSFALDDASITEALYQSVMNAFGEDRRMIEAQQVMLNTTAAEPMMGLPADAALGAYRQLYRSALAAEASS
jgi:nitrite reductase/ring-hydroxylating ferredoxin subunit